MILNNKDQNQHNKLYELEQSAIYNESQNQIRKLEQKCKNYQSIISEKEKFIKQLIIKGKILQQNRDSYKQALQKLQKQIISDEDQKFRYKKKIENQRQKMQLKYTIDIKQLRQQKQHQQIQKNNIKQQCEKFKKILDGAIDKIRRLDLVIHKKNIQIAQINAQLAKTNTQFVQTNAQFTRIKAELQTKTELIHQLQIRNYPGPNIIHAPNHYNTVHNQIRVYPIDSGEVETEQYEYEEVNNEVTSSRDNYSYQQEEFGSRRDNRGYDNSDQDY